MPITTRSSRLEAAGWKLSIKSKKNKKRCQMHLIGLCNFVLHLLCLANIGSSLKFIVHIFVESLHFVVSYLIRLDLIHDFKTKFSSMFCSSEKLPSLTVQLSISSHTYFLIIFSQVFGYSSKYSS